MRPTWTRLQGVTMAPVRGTKDKRDSRRKIRKLVLNRAPPYASVGTVLWAVVIVAFVYLTLYSYLFKY